MDAAIINSLGATRIMAGDVAGNDIQRTAGEASTGTAMAIVTGANQIGAGSMHGGATAITNGGDIMGGVMVIVLREM